VGCAEIACAAAKTVSLLGKAVVGKSVASAAAAVVAAAAVAADDDDGGDTAASEPMLFLLGLAAE